MPVWRRRRVWFPLVVAVTLVAAVGLSWFLVREGRDKADQWSSTIFGGTAAAAVVVSALAWLWRRSAAEPATGPVADDPVRTVQGPPLTVSARLDVGNYLRIREDVGSLIVPRSGHAVDITVETSGSQAVILRRMEPVVLSRHPLPEARPVHHLGQLPVRRFHLWLSEDPPRLLAEGPSGFPFKVTADDPEVFALIAHASGELVRWRLDLHWTCDGRHGVAPIDLDGEPFSTAGLADDR